MSFFSYETAKKIFFKFEPERAHSIAGCGLRLLGHSPLCLRFMKNRYFVSYPSLKQEFFGRIFHNPIGLAAGFDKNGEYISATPALGFGFTEIGTITPKAQKGNDKPRLFRLIEDRSIQNAMGFNNKGSNYMLKRLKKLYFFDYPIGINIGKNKLTSESDTLGDYEILLKAFKESGDYIVLNISSPNTPNLRDLQNENFIKAVFQLGKSITSKPIFLKLAPDMPTQKAIDLSLCAIGAGASGIIATNTTIDYALSSHAKDIGGISGALLREKSFEFFKAIAKELHDKTMLISVGGIESSEDVYRRIKAGASLVQIYSMLIYNGPQMLKDINEELIKLLKKDGYTNISQAVGADYRS